MQILNTLNELKNYLEKRTLQPGCFADTGFLYGLAYKDDRLFELANDVHDLLSEKGVPVYANVISRMELIDLVFRKQVTIGCLELFEHATVSSQDKEIYNLLKNIRDNDTAAKRNKESFKIDERRLKKLRKNIESSCGIIDWKDFCKKYVGAMLINEWSILEQDFGLNFVEVMEGQMSNLFTEPLRWADMVSIMGEQGLRGPDAMIVNLFTKSKFPLMITSDSDFKKCFTSPLDQRADKAIFHLQ